ncbi:MAG: pyridoxamine kinase [Lachnospiraceae bacterium]|nr:pyridoxamine kinase [Lachnospiraceae bacterium]
MKRILTIQDISCLGKCSLTVALPIISAMGVEAAVMPTAVLSTHTQFKDFTFRDLTSDMQPIAEHWKHENIGFDAIYTGYLGSFDQLNICEGIFKDFKTPDNTIFIDPVMGDNGKLYTGFTPEFAKAMAGLCGIADVIVPNMTEAAYMLDIPYREKYDKAYVHEVLKKLAELGAKNTVVTGTELEEGMTGFIGYNSAGDEFFEYFHEKIPVSFHGTGDIYSSCTVGALMRGFGLLEALKIAADYTCDCIRLTMKDSKASWYGVNFEEAIPALIRRLG